MMIDVETLRDSEMARADIIYVVGDIHGRLDLLDSMIKAIMEDIQTTQPNSPVVCYLGDYIDRGPHSAQVIDRLCSLRSGDLTCVFLRGNHEDRMIAFIDNPVANGPAWMRFGGREALASYGVTVPKAVDDEGWPVLRDGLVRALPDAHRAFLDNLRFGLLWRDYLLVHAGIDPGKPLTMQSERDLMWMREPFLSSDTDWGVTVVHGHVIVEEPVYRPNRIGIDTGAYQSGCLSCLALTEHGTRLMQVSA